MSIGCAIITFNEEENIERTLKSVSFCDEIVIVDSFSTDDTVKIAKKYTDKVYEREFLGYSAQKNFAISKLSTDWILSIDADEVLTPQLQEEIFQTIKNTKYDCFKIKIQLVFLDKPLKFGGAQNYHIRLFKKGFKFKEELVHEGVDAKCGARLKNKILHYSYKSIADYINKFNSYTSLAAQRKHNISSIKPFVRCFFELFKRFFIRGAFLDGYEGSLFAVLSSFYALIKYAKSRELE